VDIGAAVKAILLRHLRLGFLRPVARHLPSGHTSTVAAVGGVAVCAKVMQPIRPFAST
jgi:hypothetical protein